jgi:hypothetical protein
VPVQHGPEINIPQDLIKNLDQETAPQLEAIADAKNEMPLAGFICPAYTIRRVVIPGVRRPFGGRTGRAGGPVYYALYKPDGVL